MSSNVFILNSGVLRNFSRGAVFPKKNLEFSWPFFRSTNLMFQVLRKYYKDPVLLEIMRTAGKFFKNGHLLGTF